MFLKFLSYFTGPILYGVYFHWALDLTTPADTGN